MKPEEAAQKMFADWDASYPYVRDEIEQWKVNVAHGQGISGVRLLKQVDSAVCYIPKGAVPNLATLNEAQRLCQRMRAVLWADAPLPECTPSTDSDEDRDAADAATRALQDLCDEKNLAFAKTLGDAFYVGSEFGSGFVWFYVDPNGNGWQPQQIQASPQAQTTEDATTDPMTGQPWPGDFVLRYVREDGTLTDERTDPNVAMQWLPGICREVLTGRQVRMIPSTATDLWNADGVMIASLVPLGLLKRMFPRLLSMRDDELANMTQAQPSQVKDLLPRGRKDMGGQTSDETLVYVLTRYHTQSAEYPKGAYLVAAGGNTLLYPSPENGETGEWWDAEHAEPLDIPLTQMAHFFEHGNPYYVGLMEKLGPGNELLAYCFGAVLDQLDRLTNRKTFLPYVSNLTPEQLQSPTATVLYTTPGGKPEYEDLPDVPKVITETIEFVRAQMKDESNLQDPIGGQNPAGVDSAVHARTIIEQVNQTLSELKQNCERGINRGYSVVLQLYRAFFTIPQQVRYVGDDGAYKVEALSSADLGNTRDVRINKGSFTMLAPSSKAALAQNLFEIKDAQGNGVFGVEDLREVVAGNTGGLLGVQDNPHLLRVKRQIGKWRKGPPEGWVPPQQVMDPRTQQPTLTPDPVSAQLWAGLPVDVEPQVARTRAYELGRAMAGTGFNRWPQGWQRGLVTEYQRMAQAANIQTIPQLQQQVQQLQGQLQQAGQAQQAGEQEQAASTLQAHKDAMTTAASQVNAAVEGLLQQNAQGQQALSAQQVQLLTAHHQELMQVLASAAEHVARAIPAPSPNGAGGAVSVTVPPSDQTQAVMAEIGQALAATTAALAALQEQVGAMQAAPRPVAARVIYDKSGKVEGMVSVMGTP